MSLQLYELVGLDAAHDKAAAPSDNVKPLRPDDATAQG